MQSVRTMLTGGIAGRLPEYRLIRTCIVESRKEGLMYSSFNRDRIAVPAECATLKCNRETDGAA